MNLFFPSVKVRHCENSFTFLCISASWCTLINVKNWINWFIFFFQDLTPLKIKDKLMCLIWKVTLYKMKILKIDLGVTCKLITWLTENHLIDKCRSHRYVIVLKFKVFKILSFNAFNAIETFKTFTLTDK